ncbi:site-2 protease family protein [Salinibaculum rarum]|uniref:site-2 protease family protein n=1 Tax=Salinibaculum rarum TaxID=3058903 RepID=UPI00265DF774|nr:site-2 protease family protein [Salinibaculum sp. KK48]
MATPAVPGDVPDPDSFAETFTVYEVEVTDENVRYYGEPLDQHEEVLRRLAPRFRQRGYRVTIRRETGEFVLVATERSLGVDGIPWTNVVLFVVTAVTTLFAGARWYGYSPLADPVQLLDAWPFAVSVLGVLAVHELGHYVLSRYHSVEASLPYFIPLPNVLGTLGAVIRMRDNIPSRRALFDIGAAGPLAGIAATVVVTAVGVSLPPVAVPQNSLIAEVELGFPLLVQGIAAVLGEPLQYSDPNLMVNPVVIGGWVGAFVTFLNLLPVGQLDGAHVTRAIVGERISLVQRAVPLALFGLAGYLIAFAAGRGATLWILWGILTIVFTRVGNATPVDESSVGPARQAVAALTLLVGILCFTPVPIAFAV